MEKDKPNPRIAVLLTKGQITFLLGFIDAGLFLCRREIDDNLYDLKASLVTAVREESEREA